MAVVLLSSCSTYCSFGIFSSFVLVSVVRYCIDLSQSSSNMLLKINASLKKQTLQNALTKCIAKRRSRHELKGKATSITSNYAKFEIKMLAMATTELILRICCSIDSQSDTNAADLTREREANVHIVHRLRVTFNRQPITNAPQRSALLLADCAILRLLLLFKFESLLCVYMCFKLHTAAVA